MALSPGWRVFASFPMNRYVVLWKAVRSSGFPLFPWGHCPWRGTGSLLDPKMKAFLEENTEVTSNGSLTPEIRLRLLTPRCKFWWERADLWPLRDPYWAIYWPGGQALSRYLLDNPDLVRGKSVLDIGSGCGATAIAAKMSGALRILANDIDPKYTMRNAGLDEAQAGIKTAERSINNLRYADDTTLMAESEEELKSLLMKVKEESEKAGLKLNIEKTKTMVSGPITSGQTEGGKM
ncbi:electron transfer flavoprotein beta subunit lysine methyltransferase isoform X3 [Bos mutus]|uniref:electron transfer flavoprotein beta subunit lysine methyltransferase isoform X3 n=1 Tax=Bos mutus TaxID=72004 RepID=UPI0038B51CEA